MKWLVGAIFTLFVLQANAAVLIDTTGHKYPGVVRKVLPHRVEFLVKQKAGKEILEDDDIAFKARSFKFYPKIFFFEDTKTIDGMTPETFYFLYHNNPVLKLKYTLEYAWAMKVQKGGFAEQLKALAVFLGLLGMLVPLLTWLGGRMGGARDLTFFGSIGFVLVIYGVAWGLMKLFIYLALSGVQFFHTPTGQLLSVIGGVLLAGMLIAMGFKKGLLGGLGMMAGWVVGLYASIYLIGLI